MEPFMAQTLSVLFLLVISSFTYIFSKKNNLPYTVLLVLVGLLLVPISSIPFLSFIDDFKLTPDLLFYVFLPVLLFESAYNIKYRQLITNWKSIAALAIFGLLISSTIVSTGLYFLLGLVGFQVPFLVCFLFGVIISATDPVAVLSIFKQLGAPRRLTILFEGESLFNDGTAVALFFVVLGIIYEGGNITALTFLDGTWKFSSMLFGGILFGSFMGVLFSRMMGKIKNNEEVEIVLTMLLAHITFILSEIITHFVPFLPISGVIATVVASILIGNYGRYKITPRVEVHMQKFWEFFAFVSNSIVFILMGLILSSLDHIEVGEFVLPVTIAIFVVITARIISVYIPLGILNALKVEEHIPSTWLRLLSWSSLRGALALMMVLLIPGPGEEHYEKLLAFQNSVGWDFSYSIKDFLLVLTIACIFFTLFIKATTTPLIMKFFKIDKLHRLEEFEYEEGRILTNLKIIQKLNLSYKKAYLTQVEYEELKNKYTRKLNHAAENMKQVLKGKEHETTTLLRRAIGLHALGIEKQYLKELFFYNEIDERNFRYILRKIERQIERLERGESQLASICNLKNDYDIFTKAALFVFKRKSTDLDKYIRNRTRVVITRKVIKELRYLSEIDFGFDPLLFEETIELYAKFHKLADEKRIHLLSIHKATINAIESRLVNKSLLKLEEKTIKDLYHKEIITPKLYIKFMEEIEDEMYSDVKRFL